MARTAQALILAAALGSAALVPAAAAELDSRVERADALLADASTYDEAVRLYNAYLLEYPDDDSVRLRLARVLSWSGDLDTSLEQYDALRDRGGEAEVERAEVLSWAGRYRESEAAFRAILQREPSHARAARGLARVYLWSGRAHEADRAYARALEIDDDKEARSEWEGLRSLYRPSAGARATRHGDNNDFRFDRIEADGSAYLDLRTRAHARVAYLRTRGDVTAAGGSERIRYDGAEYAAGVERHFGAAWLGALHLGHLVWEDASDHVTAGATLRYTPNDESSFEFEYLHTGAAEFVDSVAALDEGVRWDDLRLSAWRALPRRFELWGRVSGGWLSDSNSRFRGEGQLSYQPFAERDLSVSLGSSYLAYFDESDLYYSPDWEVENQLELQYKRPLWRGFRAALGGGSGFGTTRDGGSTSSGFAYHVASQLFWEWRKWAVELAAVFAQSRRESAYRSHRFTVGLSRSF